jgi:hypothetical protein
MHPNIPRVNEPWLKILLRRIGLFVLALMVPEVIFLWAMRQWLVARNLKKEYQGEDRPLLPIYPILIVD